VADNETPMPSDRRVYARHPVEIPIVVIAPWLGQTRITHGNTANLSESGMGARVPTDLRLGQDVSVEFEAPLTRQMLKLWAVVRFQQDHDYGFEFRTPSEEQRHHLRQIPQH
jgi:hypothetical protein